MASTSFPSHALSRADSLRLVSKKCAACSSPWSIRFSISPGLRSRFDEVSRGTDISMRCTLMSGNASALARSSSAVTQKKPEAEGLEGESFAEKIDGYQKMVE